jgi:hypothetical protein
MCTCLSQVFGSATGIRSDGICHCFCEFSCILCTVDINICTFCLYVSVSLMLEIYTLCYPGLGISCGKNLLVCCLYFVMFYRTELLHDVKISSEAIKVILLYFLHVAIYLCCQKLLMNLLQ